MFTGKTLFSQEELSQDEVAFTVLAATLPFVTGGNLRLGDDILTKIDDVLSNAVVIKIGGKVDQFKKTGSFEQAIDDFKKITGNEGTTVSTKNGTVTTFDFGDGNSASVRDFSSGGTPTVQVNYNDGTKTKIRYSEGE